MEFKGREITHWSELEPLPVYYDKLLDLGNWTPAHVQVLPVRYRDEGVRAAVTVYTDEPWAPFTPEQAQQLVDAVLEAKKVVEGVVLPQEVVDLTHAHYDLADQARQRPFG